jgi:hypothetical protein
MARTKKSVYQRQQHSATKAAKSAAKHAVASRLLLRPIRAFRIPVTRAKLSMDQWDAYAPQRFFYGVPMHIKYGAENQLECFRIPVTKEQHLVGYVIIPMIYKETWRYLCRCVEYWLAIWKCWDGELKKSKKKTKTQRDRAHLVDISCKNAGARFLEAMVARRTVVADCMASIFNNGRIPSLDEFIIRNKRDWLFTEFDELPDDADKYLKADPLHPDNKALFGRT